jgi:hypothetical protein
MVYRIYITSLLLLTVLLSGCFSESYDECILKNVKPGLSEEGILYVRAACLNKTSQQSPDKPCLKRELSAEELNKLNKTAQVYPDSRTLEISVYNGNKELVITSITVELIMKSGDNQKYLLPNSDISPLSDKKLTKSIPSVDPTSIAKAIVVGGETCK